MRALHSFVPRDTRDAITLKRMLSLAQAVSTPFDRMTFPAHFTASGLVISPCGEWVCLGYHKKLGAWLQFGGHADQGENDPFRIACRETREESGISHLRSFPHSPVPLDLDIHTIPPYGNIPEHEHYDIRYLFIASPDRAPTCRPEEHHQVRWFSRHELRALNLDQSLQRSIARAFTLITAQRMNDKR